MNNPTTLTAEMLLIAYSNGYFPMAEDGEISWYDPDPRAIITFEQFHVPKRLRRTVKKRPYRITCDHAFRSVVEHCAEITPFREATWINEEIIDAYTELHEMGYAHSIEAWQGETLVGGLYGVSINGYFAGESMFSRATDASKICFVHLVELLQKHNFQLIDSQIINDHMAQFGVIEIAYDFFHARLQQALNTAVTPLTPMEL